jgi:hypothetical protein
MQYQPRACLAERFPSTDKHHTWNACTQLGYGCALYVFDSSSDYGCGPTNSVHDDNYQPCEYNFFAGSK